MIGLSWDRRGRECDDSLLEREVEADRRIDLISKAEGRLFGSFCEINA